MTNSEVGLRPRESLFDFQLQAIDLVTRLRRVAVFLKPGLGKTCITLTALIRIPEVQKVLVLAPAAVVERKVWTREAQAWEHLKHLDVLSINGTAKQRSSLLGEISFIDVVSYENFIWLSEQVDVAERYDALTMDELSKIKTPGTQRFKRLRHVADTIPVRIGLTGSPVGNHLLDLWGEVYQAIGSEPLGGTFTGFRNTYFCPVNPDVPREMMTYELKHPDFEQAIYDKIKPFAFSLDSSVVADRLPKVQFTPIELLLPKSVRKIEEDLEHDLKVELAGGVTLEALSKSTLGTKLRQIASGAVYYRDAEKELRALETGVPLDAKKDWVPIHDVKIQALREILEEQQGEPVLCVYWFQHELERLLAAFPKARLATDQKALDDWDARKVELLLAHPQSAGHGLNLQAGGSTICMFSNPWSFEMFEQIIARLARTGQLAKWVTVLVLLAGKADHDIWDVLQSKGQVQSKLMDAIRMESFRLEDDPMFG
jgi:SNF2 family DNA or RNA helicase